ncbi:hypothetical protein N9R43_01840 [bacterium]|nr:hypothetical protein [bacterium]
MYKIISITEEVMIVDDFLPEDVQDRILNQVQVDKWKRTDEVDDKFWHVTDGLNYKNQKRWHSDYPHKDNSDLWFEHFHKFLTTCPEVENFVDGASEGIEDFAMRCHAYPVNSKNPWHYDLGFSTYTYYLHKEWQVNWDSTLLVLPKGSAEYHQTIDLMEGTVHYDSYKEINSPMEMFQQKNKYDNIMDVGRGQFVMPKPNRLVLIKHDTIHGITRVDSDAGENVRVTLTGAVADKSWRERLPHMRDVEKPRK